MIKSTNNTTSKHTIDIDRIIRNSSFSMEVEGFHIPPEQQDEVRRVLTGELDADELRQSYIAEAERHGATSYGDE